MLLPALLVPLLVHTAAAHTTGKVRKYNFTVSTGYQAPDGYLRPVYLINGQFPGPLIEADEGDTLEIYTENHTPTQWTIHWHGLFQRGTPEMDGVAGVSQWSILPGANYTYRFETGDQYGPYWAHAHERSYYGDGIRAPILIRPRPGRERPFGLITNDTNELKMIEEAEKESQVLFISDWYHLPEDTLDASYVATLVDTTCTDSVLINGKGRVYCPTADYYHSNAGGRENMLPGTPALNDRGCLPIQAPTSTANATEVFGLGCRNTTSPIHVVTAEAGQKYLYLDLVQASAEWELAFSIDAHSFWIVSADGSFIVPQKVNYVSIPIGERYGVVIPLDQAPGGYAMRFSANVLPQLIEGISLLSYNVSASSNSSSPSVEQGFSLLQNRSLAFSQFNGTATSAAIPFNESAAFPFNSTIFPLAPIPQHSNYTISYIANATGGIVWELDSSLPFNASFQVKKPILFQGDNSQGFAAEGIPVHYIPHGSVVDLLIVNVPFNFFGPGPPHPIHLHGHKFWLLGSGTNTSFPYKTVSDAQKAGESFNLINPPLRDGANLPLAGWLALRYVADNPGAWPLHCHIDTHLFAGMMSIVFEGADVLPLIPQSFLSAPHVPDATVGDPWSKKMRRRVAGFFSTIQREDLSR